MKRKMGFIITLVGVMFLSACASRLETATKQADIGHLKYREISTSRGMLASWGRNTAPGQPVTVYLEGDGMAYGAGGYPSHDPTPRQPLALMLAARDPAANVVYLARPCQYVGTASCTSADWTNRRFSPAMADRVSEAVDAVLLPGQKVHLVGYSGGGTLGVMLALRRHDVLSLRTVAGAVDPYGFNSYHRATEVLEAEDLLPLAPRLAKLPQIHFSGSEDQTVPPFFAETFVAKEGQGACAKLRVVKASHSDGWVEQWSELVATPLPTCSSS